MRRVREVEIYKAGWGGWVSITGSTGEGYYTSPFGNAIIYFFNESNKKYTCVLSVTFVYNGREYRKRIRQRKPFTKRSAMVMAGKFIREVVFKLSEAK